MSGGPGGTADCVERRSGTMGGGTTNSLDILIAAIILPPLGVFLKFGCKVEFLLCVILTFFGYLPGLMYAVYAITK